MGDVLTAEFSPRRDVLEKFETDNLDRRLVEWEGGLPDVLQKSDSKRHTGEWFWSVMLQFCYQ